MSPKHNPLSWNEIKTRAVEFSKEWEDETSEKAESQTFWNEFFHIFGIKRRRIASFENHVKKLNNKDGFIDLFWPGTLLVEHKSRGISLDEAYDQGMDYFDGLEEYELPKYVIVSDFATLVLHDLDENTSIKFKLKELVDNIHLFDFIAGYEKPPIKESDPVNIAAAELMGDLHDKLKEIGYEGHELEVYLVRLLFCLFADDTNIFERDIFLDFIQNRTSSDGSDLAPKLEELFQVLNTPEDQRLKTVDESLKVFPYINGKLFEERLGIASFDRGMRRKLFETCHLDWGKVSPAIFGSLFQYVMDPELQRQFGSHYTSEKNILKVINSLFMDELWMEFNKIKTNKNKLKQFHDKIANLKFFDPACGCGNFLIIAYKELRILEIEIIKILYSRSDGDIQKTFHIQDLSRINVDSFYGIEIEEFPARIAEVSMWMMDHLMNRELSFAMGHYFTRLPLKTAANIYIENALRTDWTTILMPADNVYIFGNPPFAGKQYQDEQQKADLAEVFKGVKNKGLLDYVTAWYLKAAQYIQGTNIKVGFVSTNSISQGEQVSVLWGELFQNYGIKIHFAHRTFKWKSESKNAAAVYVVIVSFATYDIKQDKYLFEYQTPTSEAYRIKVKNINPYLVEGDDLVIASRRKAICDVPKLIFGSMPNDGGNFLFTDEEKKAFIKNEASSEKYFKRILGGKEYIHNIFRWCLWLVDADPAELRRLPNVMKRIDAVKQHRLDSKRKATRKLAKYPTLFGENRQPKNDYIIVPLITSERREYIPIGFLEKDIIASNKCSIISKQDLYVFGIIISKMHMTWMRYVAGRLKGDYNYSNTIVYNNFPWPKNPSKRDIKNVEKKAKEILEVRKEFKDSSLADLYDPLTMPTKLVKAHRELDKAVDKCYGKRFDSDRKRIESLFRLYDEYLADV